LIAKTKKNRSNSLIRRVLTDVDVAVAQWSSNLLAVKSHYRAEITDNGGEIGHRPAELALVSNTKRIAAIA
jgi:hypothetical protein